VDPPRSELASAQRAFEDEDHVRAQRLFTELRAKYPSSAIVELWLGEATLYAKKLSDGRDVYQDAASAALKHYARAHSLHQRGCVLPDPERYYLHMGTAYAELRLGHTKQALAALAPAHESWPDSAEITYTQARAACAAGDVDACVTHFEQTLRIANSLRRPSFIRTHRSLEDWILRARTQSEFVNLRADPRYTAVIERARAAAPSP
jgi:tetratricopeptide (TPR) repeat protein